MRGQYRSNQWKAANLDEPPNELTKGGIMPIRAKPSGTHQEPGRCL